MLDAVSLVASNRIFFMGGATALSSFDNYMSPAQKGEVIKAVIEAKKTEANYKLFSQRHPLLPFINHHMLTDKSDKTPIFNYINR